MVFAAAYAVNVSRGFNPQDESWFLQVVARTNRGDVLYRDVFYGSMPLTVYVLGGITRLLGTEMLVVKAVSVAVFTATAGLAFHLSRRFGLGRPASLTVVLALVAFAIPTIGLYGDLASLLLLASLAAALRWVRLTTDAVPMVGWWRHPLVLGGVAAGLCFGAKQNAGALALAALVGTAALAPVGRRRLRVRLLDAARPVPAFLVVVGLVIVPVVVSGGAARLWDYGFANKGTYVRLGRESYFDQLDLLARLVAHLPGAALAASIQAAILLPPLALAALVVTWPRLDGRERAQAFAILAFLLAAVLVVYPRADSAHLADAAPVSVVAIAYAASRWAGAFPRAQPAVLAAALGGLGLAVAAIVGWALLVLVSPDYGALAAPHFGGVPLPAHTRTAMAAEVAALGALPPDRLPVLLLSPDAGFGYLSTGLRNPSPFDYPVATAFGRRGQAATVAALETGRIASVCRSPAIDQPLRPVELDSFVTSRLRPGNDIGPCQLFLAGPVAAPAPGGRQ